MTIDRYGIDFLTSKQQKVSNSIELNSVKCSTLVMCTQCVQRERHFRVIIIEADQ